MLLVSHIVIALATLLLATVSMFKPTFLRLRFCYVLAAITFATGGYLVVTSPKPSSHAPAGVAYLILVGLQVIYAKAKLAKQTKLSAVN